MKRLIKDNYFIALVLIFSAILLFSNLNKPFIGHHDWNGAFWGEMTRRYLDLMGIGNWDYLSGSNVSFKTLFFPDYTPLLPVMFATFSIIFGISEFTLRMVPAIFSLAMIFFIYKIGELLFGKTVGLIASTFAAVTPMFLYFGKIPDHEPIVASLISATFYFYLKTFNNGPNYTLLFLILLFLSLLESWPAFFLIPPIVIFSLLNKAKVTKVLLPVALAILVIVFHLSLILYSRGISGVLTFFNQGYLRSNSSTEFIGGFSNYSTLSFVTTEAHYAVIYFTRILLVFAILWIASVATKILQRKTSQLELSLLILLVYPAAFVLIFRQLAFIHDYKLYHFLPFISLSSASFLNSVFSRLEQVFKKKLKYKINFLVTKIAVYFVIIAFVFTERLNYLNTLLKTSFNTPGYELGLLVKANTHPDDSVLVNSRQFKAFFEVFVNYYADRKVDYEDIYLENFKKNQGNYKIYKYIILIDGREVDTPFLEYMESFPYTRFGPYRFFDNTYKIS